MLKYYIFSNNAFIKQNNVRNYRSGPTHYDVLNLKPNCTTKEIRDSFLELSKKFHPDVRGASSDPKNTTEFVKIMEAYNILSKESSRKSYDLNLQSRHNMSEPAARATTPSWSHFHNSNKNPGSYYGVKGIKKVSNMKIVGILLVIAALGTALEFYLVRNSLTFRRERLDEISRAAGIQHANVRADAQKYGNLKQLERLGKKLHKGNET